MNKKKIAVVTGGYSGENSISLMSADVVIRHLPSERFNSVLITIDRDGWTFEKDGMQGAVDKNDFSVNLNGKKITFDCAFMALHGTPAEDGKLPAYFDMIGLPYTCCNPAVSALTFNKGYTNSVLKKHGIQSAKSIILSDKINIDTAQILQQTGLPCFVKPNEGGSSLGISKVNNAGELTDAIELAFSEDKSVIIEEFIEGTEITCAVATIRGKTEALPVTEIVTGNDFFDYEAKYNDLGTQEITPARITQEQTEECQANALHIYKTLGCSGIIRIDYILRTDELYMLEVNTIPGLSEKSIVPKMAAHANIGLDELFTYQLDAAIQKMAGC
ncbi:MAG: D-alanine--D-alanine ligase [Flavobacteriales bacterium]